MLDRPSHDLVGSTPRVEREPPPFRIWLERGEGVNPSARIRGLLILGLVLVAWGLLANAWLPTGLISVPTAERYSERRSLLQILSIASLAIGFSFIVLRRQLARIVPQMILLGIVTLFCLCVFVAGDIALGTMKFARSTAQAAERNPADSTDVGEVLFLPDPLAGWIRTPGSHDRDVTEEFDVVYEIDEFGFRQIPNTGTPRRSIYVFGDSFAFGKGVHGDETFAGVMRREWLAEDVHIFNAALGGQGVVQMYGRFRSYEDRLRRGDLVIFAPISPDLRRNFEDFSFASRTIYHNSGKDGVPEFPIYRNGKLETIATDNAWYRFKSYFFLGRETRKFFDFMHAAFAAPDTTEDAIAMMADARRRCAERDVDFALIFLPKERELRKGRYREDVSGFSFLSIWDAFPQGDAARSIRIGEDSHWNANGHSIASRAIVERLMGAGLLTPNDLRPGRDAGLQTGGTHP